MIMAKGRKPILDVLDAILPSCSDMIIATQQDYGISADDLVTSGRGALRVRRVSGLGAPVISVTQDGFGRYGSNGARISRSAYGW